MPTIDVRLDGQDSDETRYIYDDTGDYLYMRAGGIFHYDGTSDEITGLCDMRDLTMLIKALERIRSDSQPTVSSHVQQSIRSA